MQIVVATHNEGKLVEIRRILEEDLGPAAADIELVSAGSLHLPRKRPAQGPRRGQPYRFARHRGRFRPHC